MDTTPTRHFELKLLIRSNNKDFATDSFDVVMADDLVSLLSQFMVVIASIHRRILEEDTRVIKGIDWGTNDIPF